MPDMTSPAFIVVGGGVAGMVTARRLALAGLSVVVLESSARVGGTVSSHVVGGITLDAGAESFATRGGTVRALIDELGLAADIVEPLAEGAWLHPAAGAPFRLPLNSLLGIPGTPLAADVIRAIGRPAAQLADADRLMAGSFAADSRTLGELVRRRMGDAVLDQLVRPIVANVQGIDPDALPLDAASPGLRAAILSTGSLAAAVTELRLGTARAGSAVAGIRGGVFRLSDALHDDLVRLGVEVRLGARAADVQPESVVVDGEMLRGRVVLASPPSPHTGPSGGHGVLLATLVIDESALDAAPRGTGVLVASVASGIRANALTHATAKWAWLAEVAGPGRHVLRLSYSPENILDSDDLRAIALSDASALLGIPLAAAGVRGFASAEWYRPARQTHTPNGMQAVGESIAGTGLAAVVSQAEAVAARVIADRRPQPGTRTT